MTINNILDKIKKTSLEYSELYLLLLNIAKEASNIALKYYKRSDLDIQIKGDESPVTAADLAVNKYIVETLENSKFKDLITILSEELNDNRDPSKKYTIIIDPIDGTDDFIKQTDEFAINIAICENHQIKEGIIAVPAKKLIYFSFANLNSFRWETESGLVYPIQSSYKTDELILTSSRSHPEDEQQEYLGNFKKNIIETAPCGSSYKACLIAEGVFDIAYKLGPQTKEWDTAPMEAILKNAGAIFLEAKTLKNFTYNREDVYNRNGYLIVNNEYTLRKLIESKQKA